MEELNLQNLKFLIVEDNPFMRVILKQLLRALNIHNVSEASDGAEAFQVMKTFHPDIILLDWAMKPLDGLDFVKLVRTGQDSPNPFVPIIMITSHSEQHKVIEARDSGINELLIKPVSAKSLYARIAAIVERPRQFVQQKDYFGPDRRRKDHEWYHGDERRKGAVEDAE